MSYYYVGNRSEFIQWFRQHWSENGLPADPNLTFRRSSLSAASGIGFWDASVTGKMEGKTPLSVEQMVARGIAREEELRG